MIPDMLLTLSIAFALWSFMRARWKAEEAELAALGAALVGRDWQR